MSDGRLFQQIEGQLGQAHRILVVTHVAPDGDALGSLLGLGWLLGAQGKELTLACQDPVPSTYAWLEGSEQIVQQGDGTYDLVVSLDCSDVRRMGTPYQDEYRSCPLLNIDHHVTNTRFGALNWVDASSASTTQMLLTLADALDWPVTPTVAVCLLSGLVTDTRSFRTSNVDTAVMQAALRLMEAGASISDVARRTLDQRPMASVRLWGQAIDAAQIEDGILWTAVTRKMYRRWDLSENDSSGLANFLSGVREAEVVIVFTERDEGIIDVGMRSVPGLNVAEPALRLGGGGHPQAAGCTVNGDLANVQAGVLEEIRNSIAAQRAAG